MREPKGNWTDLFLAFRMALDPRKMLLGFAFLLIATVIAIALARGSAYRPAIVDQLEVGALAGRGRAAQDELEELTEGAAAATRPTPPIYTVLRLPFRQWDTFLLTHGIDRATKAGNPFGVAACYALGHWLRVPAAIEKLSVGHNRPQYQAKAFRIGLWAALVLVLWLAAAFFAGAASRIAAIELARGERIELTRSLGYACRNYATYVLAPIAVAAAAAFFLLCSYVAGLFGRHLLLALVVVVGLVAAGLAWQALQKIARNGALAWAGFVVVIAVFAAVFYLLMHVAAWSSAGAIVAALLFPFSLLAGLLAVLLAIGGTCGLKLMVPAVSAEGTESFDAVSRAFSYVFLRPWRFVAYHIVGCAYGAVCIAFVLIVTTAFCQVGTRALLAGAGYGSKDHLASPGIALPGQPAAAQKHLSSLVALSGEHWSSPQVQVGQKVAAAVMLIPLALVGALMFGYVPSFAVSINTIIYFLLRKSVDDTPIHEIYVPEEAEAEPTPEAPGGNTEPH